MTKEELIQLFENEEKRLADVLPTIDPAREAVTYGRVSENLWDLHWHIQSLTNPTPPGMEIGFVSTAKPTVTTEEPYVEPTPFPDPEPSTEEYEPPVMDDKTYTKEEVRAALAKSRKKGVNVNEFLQGLGYDNFTAVPAAMYGEIMAKLGES